jgi:hypothetical protein
VKIPDSPIELLKDPYLYVLGIFGWFSIELLQTPEKQSTWYIGLTLLIFSCTLLSIRFVISIYREYVEKLFSKHYESIITQQSKIIHDTSKLLVTHNSTDMMAQKLVQNELDKSLKTTGYKIDHPDTETKDS